MHGAWAARWFRQLPSMPTQADTSIEESSMLAPDDPIYAFSPMALDVHRTNGDVVGRPAELEAIRRELAMARAGRLVGLTVEGEPGIGKTRLLVAAAACAAD